jgi:hypothetical protein
VQTKTLTEETWLEAVKAAGIRLEAIALATSKSYSAVYRYSREPGSTGYRTPPAEWLAQVTAIVAAESARQTGGAFA